MIRAPHARAAAVLAAALLAAPSFAQEADDPVVARVNDLEILQSELDGARAGLPPQLQQLPTEALYDLLVDRLIDARLLAARAVDADLESDPEVARALEAARRDTLSESYVSARIEEVVTDEAVQAAYDERAGSGALDKDEVRARHILLETEEDARAVIEELAGGADFAELAAERSTGPSGPNGGDLGFFTQDMMVAPFAEAAFAMEPGESSEEPVQTQFGYHVIKVEERRSGATPFEEIAPQIRQDLIREAVGGVIAEAREGAEIEKLGFDGSGVAPEAGPEDAQPAAEAVEPSSE